MSEGHEWILHVKQKKHTFTCFNRQRLFRMMIQRIFIPWKMCKNNQYYDLRGVLIVA